MRRFIDVPAANYAPPIRPPKQPSITGNEIKITINNEAGEATIEKIYQKIIDELNKNKPKGHGYMTRGR
jgi:hypothetical protein